jgi:glutathione S-transferase
MVQAHALVAIVTLAALLVYLWMGFSVALAHKATGIAAPAMTGDPRLERAVRIQANTLEWLPLFLVSLWLFALYWNDRIAALLGVVWIVGRVLSALGYAADPNKRGPGFGIQALATLILLFGALAGAVRVLLVTGV